MLNIDIESLIPQRAKIKIISGILEIKETTAISTAVVNLNWPSYDEGAINSLVLIEAIAQTAAIVEGYKRKQQGKYGVKGWLVGIKSAEFNVAKIPVNTDLIIMIENKYTFDNYAVVEGIIKTGGAQAMKIVLGEVARWMSGKFDQNPSFAATIHEGANVRITLMPTEKSMTGMIEKIEITLSKKTATVQSVKIIESANNFTQMNFDNVEINKAINPSVFQDAQ